MKGSLGTSLGARASRPHGISPQVIPAKAGIQYAGSSRSGWIPAPGLQPAGAGFAGVTEWDVRRRAGNVYVYQYEYAVYGNGNGKKPAVPGVGKMSSEYGSNYHVPAMVAEVLHYLRPERGGLYLDGTLGGGGHTEAILRASSEARVVGFDRDRDAIDAASSRLARFGDRFRAVQANFADGIDEAGIANETLAGALLDLGISSHQVDVEQRGFTFRAGAPLDMRMGGEEGGRTAAEVLNSWEEAELATLFYRYGEERRSRRLARVLVEMRRESSLETSDQLVAAIERAIPGAMAQDRARIFQALRMAVNEEVESLTAVLPQLLEALSSGGVLVILSYHSIEDRLVKDAFREWSKECVCPPGLPVCRCRGRRLGTTLTRKPARPGAAEVQVNPRARSARLRAWRKE